MRKVKKVKVFALLMSILLLTNFVLSIAIAANIENGNITITNFTNNIKVEPGSSNGGDSITTISTNSKDRRNIKGEKYFNFIVNTSGVYTISVYYENLSSKKVSVNYSLSRSGTQNTKNNIKKVTSFENTVCLAISESASSYQGLPSPSSVAEGNTDVSVILEENYTYGIKLAEKSLVNGRRIIVSILKQGTGGDIKYSNI